MSKVRCAQGHIIGETLDAHTLNILRQSVIDGQTAQVAAIVYGDNETEIACSICGGRFIHRPEKIVAVDPVTNPQDSFVSMGDLIKKGRG